ncbi:MAG: ImmA/IrrE family metallo-endopeptidase [Bacteroidota bacterium]|nr:ImmA/IrrE family metallo-endopeptidase [Bacteroidota bacterium]
MNDLLSEKASSSFRLDNGLNNADPIRLKSLLQKLNVITVFAPLSEKFSGMALKANKDNRFMLVNSNQSLGKQHFTICHELYHLFIQADFASQVCYTGKFDKKADITEYNADVFASYLLLPTDGLLESIPNGEIEKKNISLQTILYIEHFYSCSRRALLYRLKYLKLITAAEYDSYTTDIQKGALQNGYDVDLYKSGNHKTVIGDYGIIAKKLFDSEKVSESHYYSLLADLGIDITKIDENQHGED